MREVTGILGADISGGAVTGSELCNQIQNGSLTELRRYHVWPNNAIPHNFIKPKKNIKITETGKLKQKIAKCKVQDAIFESNMRAQHDQRQTKEQTTNDKRRTTDTRQHTTATNNRCNKSNIPAWRMSFVKGKFTMVKNLLHGICALDWLQ